MNKKQKLVSTTLSTVTALSSVGAISSLPNTVIKNVQALDENTVKKLNRYNQQLELI